MIPKHEIKKAEKEDAKVREFFDGLREAADMSEFGGVEGLLTVADVAQVHDAVYGRR